ncbi:MAG: CDP-alcohol phosphatidyltransferase family protein [Alphaproteobacteria bacterium]|nr:CDP-alcohol phosphatidyltransferase family protein [Alphaproteobacteria bacterium]
MSHNTWIHRLVRPPIRVLARTPVTPNQLTTLRLLAGLGAAAAYAVGEPFWTLLGGIFFVLSVLLDRADGELARITGITTEWGHRFDLVSDTVVNAALFIGIGVGLRDGTLGLWSVPLGLLAGLSVAAVLGLVLQMEAREGKGKPAFEGAGGFDPDDAILLVPIAMWLGWAEPLLIAAAIGAPGFTVFACLRFRLRGGRD